MSCKDDAKGSLIPQGLHLTSLHGRMIKSKGVTSVQHCLLNCRFYLHFPIFPMSCCCSTVRGWASHTSKWSRLHGLLPPVTVSQPFLVFHVVTLLKSFGYILGNTSLNWLCLMFSHDEIMITDFLWRLQRDVFSLSHERIHGTNALL